MREIDLDLLHPVCRNVFTALAVDLELAFKRGDTPHRFRVFETYRGPARQAAILAENPGATKAGPWQSAHQYGLAVDFVPVDQRGRWTWSIPVADWDFLRTAAKQRGLLNTITWDRPHVEHPVFSTIIRPRLLDR